MCNKNNQILNNRLDTFVLTIKTNSFEQMTMLVSIDHKHFYQANIILGLGQWVLSELYSPVQDLYRIAHKQ